MSGATTRVAMPHLGATLATAGHVDHGKTALVRALTGVDTDRLPEERQRGISITCGFATLSLDALTVSVVDVPGHERFIRQMVGGVGGVDAVLLVVAADEGVMPQTREHLAVCAFLGIPRLIVALTRCDLVDADWRDLAAADVSDSLADTRWPDAPVIPCSSLTGEGLPALKAAIGDALAPAATASRPAREAPFALPVDRVFTVQGFGTVVTGTCLAGVVAVGDAIAVARPGGGVGVSRVRGLSGMERASSAGARASDLR
jgi:selenocysteine-specific elongation factor